MHVYRCGLPKWYGLYLKLQQLLEFCPPLNLRLALLPASSPTNKSPHGKVTAAHVERVVLLLYSSIAILQQP